MRNKKQDGVKLPRKLLEKLGVSSQGLNVGCRNEHYGSRNVGNVQRRETQTPKINGRSFARVHEESAAPGKQRPNSSGHKSKQRSASRHERTTKTASSTSEERPDKSDDEQSDRSPEPPPKISGAARARLAEDDASIDALERALGLKDHGRLPKSFEDDGLSQLLKGLDDGDHDRQHSSKRKRREDQEWLARKRQAASDDVADTPQGNEPSDFEGFDDEESDAEDSTQDDTDLSSDQPDELPHREKRPRENPYLPPQAISQTAAERSKYLPPSLRNLDPVNNETAQVLAKRLRGLINRLSEANLLSIVSEVQKLVQEHPRQYVFSGIIGILLTQLVDSSKLQDTFIILHGGFIAALYRVLGPEFGAQVVLELDQRFGLAYEALDKAESSSKRLLNIVNTVAQLYNFQVISSKLIFDYIRLLLVQLSEDNTEMLLKVLRLSGQQLRQDDSSALREIASQLHGLIAEQGVDKLSVRTKFMIETIDELKSGKPKKGAVAADIASEHIISMKKTLGRLDQSRSKSSEPLGIALEDLREAEKRRKWWLVGSSFHGQQNLANDPALGTPLEDNGLVSAPPDSAPDLASLAREQRMNTDVRRAIFVAIMSGSDFNDSFVRLEKLRLTKSQRLQIPKIILHCAGNEKTYNPFYTVFARRLSSDRKLKMGFQFSLWDMFKRMGETDDSEGSSDEDAESGEGLEMRYIVNVARMYAELVLSKTLDLGVLKTLTFTDVKPKTGMFLELLLMTVILQSQRPERDEKRLLELLVRPVPPQLADDLRYFLRKVLSKTDITSDEDELTTIKWGCKVAGEALLDLSKQLNPGEG